MEAQEKIRELEERLRKSESGGRILEAKLQNQLKRYERLEAKNRKTQNSVEKKMGQETRKRDLLLSQLHELEQKLMQTELANRELRSQLSRNEAKNQDLESVLDQARGELFNRERELQAAHQKELETLKVQISRLRKENEATQDRFSKMFQARTQDYDRLNEEFQRLKLSQSDLLPA